MVKVEQFRAEWAAGKHVFADSPSTHSVQKRKVVGECTSNTADSIGGSDRTHRIWLKMRGRCSDPNNLRYHRYGGRGITVCDRWQILANFLSDMGPVPEGKSIDRINNDGNYEPANCRWATREEQNANKPSRKGIKLGPRKKKVA